MKCSWLHGLTALVLVALALPFSKGCQTLHAAEGYVVCVPRTLHSNSTVIVSFKLYDSEGP